MCFGEKVVVDLVLVVEFEVSCGKIFEEVEVIVLDVVKEVVNFCLLFEV